MAQSCAARMLMAIALAFASGAEMAEARALLTNGFTPRQFATSAVDQAPQESPRRLVLGTLTGIGKVAECVNGVCEMYEEKEMIKRADAVDTLAGYALDFMGVEAESLIKEVPSTFVAAAGGGTLFVLQLKAFAEGKGLPSKSEFLDMAKKLLGVTAVALEYIDCPVASQTASLGSGVAAVLKGWTELRELFCAPSDQNSPVPAASNPASSSFSGLPGLMRKNSRAAVTCAALLFGTGCEVVSLSGQAVEESLTADFNNLELGDNLQFPTDHGSAVGNSPTRPLPSKLTLDFTTNGGIDIHLDSKAQHRMANILLGSPKTKNELEANWKRYGRVLYYVVQQRGSDAKLLRLFIEARERLSKSLA